MQRSLSHLILLLGFQMRSVRERISCGIILAAALLLSVYSINTFTALLQVYPAGDGNNSTSADRVGTTVLPPGYGPKTAPPATITTSVYKAQLHWAIPYIPLSPDERLIEARPGHRFVVLDMSFRNITSDREVDMGLVALTAVVQDEQGREYYSDALAIASLQREYPFPQHELQYNRMRGVLQPGDVCRTTFFAFEAPADLNSFILNMEDGGRKKYQLHQAAFTVR